MRHLSKYILSGLFLLQLVACASAPLVTPPPAQPPAVRETIPAESTLFPVLDAWLADNGMTVSTGRTASSDYERAFSQGAVIAYGEGRPSATAEGSGKQRLTALRAAEVTAQRNLAVYIARYATGGEVTFNNRTVKTEALLRGARLVAQEYDPARGKAAVLLRLDLQGATGFTGGLMK